MDGPATWKCKERNVGRASQEAPPTTAPQVKIPQAPNPNKKFRPPPRIRVGGSHSPPPMGIRSSFCSIKRGYQFDCTMTHGKGSYLWTSAGKKCLNFCGEWWYISRNGQNLKIQSNRWRKKGRLCWIFFVPFSPNLIVKLGPGLCVIGCQPHGGGVLQAGTL